VVVFHIFATAAPVTTTAAAAGAASSNSFSHATSGTARVGAAYNVSTPRSDGRKFNMLGALRDCAPNMRKFLFRRMLALPVSVCLRRSRLRCLVVSNTYANCIGTCDAAKVPHLARPLPGCDGRPPMPLTRLQWARQDCR
jgi:hypothetical protein